MPRGNLRVLEICIICPEACQAVVQLCVPYLSPSSSSVCSSSSVPVPLQPLGAAGTHQHPGQYLGRGRASLGCPEPTLHLPMEHPMVPPHGQEVEETPPHLHGSPVPCRETPSPAGAVAMEGSSVLSPSSWERRRAWARQSRCWRTTVVEEEAAAAMQDVPELQPPHLDDVFLEGWGDPGVAHGTGVPPSWVISRVFLCPPPGSPSSKIETWLQECG